MVQWAQMDLEDQKFLMVQMDQKVQTVQFDL
jgi:hypothetical protein